MGEYRMETRERLKGIMRRQGLSKKGLADYLGVPEQTCFKWITGERLPSAAVIRLIDVLEMIEMLAPDIHNSIMVSMRKS